MARRSDKSN